MNGAPPAVISFDKSAAGPAGRAGAVVVDEAGSGVVVSACLLLLPLEHADATTASTVHATIAAGGAVFAKRCMRQSSVRQWLRARGTVTMLPATGKPGPGNHSPGAFSGRGGRERASRRWIPPPRRRRLV